MDLLYPLILTGIAGAGGIIALGVMLILQKKRVKQTLASIEKRHKDQLKELKELKNEFHDVSQRAGMAEISSNVLQSVANVLVKTTGSTATVISAVSGSKITALNLLTKMLQQHKDDYVDYIERSPKGRELPDILLQLTVALNDEQKNIIHELKDIEKAVNDIRDIIDLQKKYTGVSGVKEQVNLEEMLGDAITLLSVSLRNAAVSVSSDIPDKLPTLFVDRHPVMQILVTIIDNACEALKAGPEGKRILSVKVKKEENSLVTSFSDNGRGISQKEMGRLFEYGFTTKKGSHGYGLYHSKLLAEELGGTLSASSEGLGRGATFSLSLPISKGGAQL